MPTPAPGGARRIVYWSKEGGSYDLFSALSDGTGKVRLTTDAATDETQAEISPDGTKIVYVSRPKTSSDQTIKAMNVDGTNPIALTGSDTANANPSWSPDGTKIIFQADNTTDLFSDTGIWMVNADSTGLVRISKNTKKDYEGPDWSPDGTKVAFVIDQEIYVMNIDGTGETKLTDGGMFYYLSPKIRPVWSPDGTKLLYTRINKEAPSISDSAQAFLMNADGSNPVKLTDGTGRAWSADGTKILVYRTNMSTGAKLIQINSDGTGETVLPLNGNEGTW